MNLCSVEHMGYYAGFPRPIPHLGAHSIVLLTLPPLSPLARFSFDLHVLAMPPAFNLSQDQTLRLFSVVPIGLAAFRGNYEGLPEKPPPARSHGNPR